MLGNEMAMVCSTSRGRSRMSANAIDYIAKALRRPPVGPSLSSSIWAHRSTPETREVGGTNFQVSC